MGNVPSSSKTRNQTFKIPANSEYNCAEEIDESDNEDLHKTDNDVYIDDGKSIKTTGENEELIVSESLVMAFSVLNDEDAKEFRKDEEGVYTEAFQEAISDIDNAYSSEMSSVRDKCGEFLSMNSYGAVDRLCDVIVDLCESGYRNREGDIICSNYLIFKDSLSILWNFTGRNHNNDDEMIKLCDYPCFLKCLTGKLKDIEVKTNVDDLDENSQIAFSIINIYHNLTMVEDNVDKIHSRELVDILARYLESPQELCRLTAIAVLADILDEKESEILQKGQNTFKFLMEGFSSTLEDPESLWQGWYSWELARTMRQIARNDTNKKALLAYGAVPMLVELSQSFDEKEQREAVMALWTLAFDKDNQKFMTSDPDLGIIETFVSGLKAENAEMRTLCEGALWTLKDELECLVQYKDIASVKSALAYLYKSYKTRENQKNEEKGQIDAISKDEDSCDRGHIMISYHSANRTTLLKVKDRMINGGYRVWMDVDNMEGSIIDSMATAVENAEIVLLCFSRGYKGSANCRAEAEYAYRKKKQIIPLRMESKYEPDGWLGFIVGSKKYYDFGGKRPFDTELDCLFKELRHVYFEERPLSQSFSERVYQVVEMSKQIETEQTPKDITDWSEQQVLHWVDKYGLDREKFGRLTGVEISYLRFLLQQSPEVYHKTTRKDLKIKDLLTQAKFKYALDHAEQ